MESSRGEIAEDTFLIWQVCGGDARAVRREKSFRCLQSLHRLLGEEGTMLNVGVEPAAHTADDRRYLLRSFSRFNGDFNKAVEYMKRVNDVVIEGREFGKPTREQVRLVAFESRLPNMAGDRRVRVSPS